MPHLETAPSQIKTGHGVKEKLLKMLGIQSNLTLRLKTSSEFFTIKGFALILGLHFKDLVFQEHRQYIGDKQDSRNRKPCAREPI